MRLPNGRDEFERQLTQAIVLEDGRNQKNDADIYIIPPRRLYLQSPDGTLFRLAVNDNGQLQAIGWEAFDGIFASDAVAPDYNPGVIDGAIASDGATYV